MGFINELIGYPLGWVMWLIYKAIPYYGIALLVFTIFTRLLMLPSTIKQQKSSAIYFLLLGVFLLAVTLYNVVSIVWGI